MGGVLLLTDYTWIFTPFSVLLKKNNNSVNTHTHTHTGWMADNSPLQLSHHPHHDVSVARRHAKKHLMVRPRTKLALRINELLKNTF